MARHFRWLTSVVAVALMAFPCVGWAAGGDPDPEQVIERHLGAIGGREALGAIHDRTVKARLEVFGTFGAMEWHEKTPNKLHQFIDMGMAQIESWFDGEKGYRNDPMQGAGPFTAEEIEEAKGNYVIIPLLTYKERGSKACYLETANVGDRPAHVVELGDPRGKAVRYYFDVASHETVKIIAPLPIREGAGDQEFLLSDYREVGGVKFPFKLTRTTPTMTVDITLESIETNTGLDDAIFRAPGQ